MPLYLFTRTSLHVDGCDAQNRDSNAPKWVALAVAQSYNPRRKVPRSEISLLHLENCLSKAACSAAQSSGNMLPHLFDALLLP